MSIKKRGLLRKQLEQQGELIVSETNDIKLIQSLLATCAAFLHIAHNDMPSTFTQEEFNAVYAAYLRVVSKVRLFSDKCKEYLNKEQSAVLDKLLESQRLLEEQKKDLEYKISKVRRKEETEKREIDAEKAILSKAQERLEVAEKQHNALQKELDNKKKSLDELGKEKESITSQINGFELDVERLTKEVTDAKVIYGDMVSYYSELERIQAGIREEGYVSISSYIEKIQDMNVQGKALMLSYDKLLKGITEDVEALQDRIKKKQKSGVVE